MKHLSVSRFLRRIEDVLYDLIPAGEHVPTVTYSEPPYDEPLHQWSGDQGMYGPGGRSIPNNITPYDVPALLAEFMGIGYQYHQPTAREFVRKTSYSNGRAQYDVCPVASCYAGMFGEGSIRNLFENTVVKDNGFEGATWQMSNYLGIDLNQITVDGPTGNQDVPILQEIQDLTDSGWAPEHIGSWLMSIDGQGGA